ncbi:class I adenylate-forming enzyme family protein [Bradyrhizobium erythrophlei]|uniref:class I adenylate-forming enzyme family protein n=1 Tax=Bradyrhizobium erythrophlei TaxID=1437360 RepID=UPI0035E599B9
MSVQPNTVEAWAASRPDDVAFIEGDRQLTWSQLNDAANRVAHSLAARGVVAGDIVVLRTQIRIEWPILSEALGKLRCSLLGLNWRLTPSETQYVLSNSGATVVVCDDDDPAALKPAFEGLPIKLAVSIGAASPGFVAFSSLLTSPAEPPLFAAGRPPLILYTSGTTGLPKGVVSVVQPGVQMDARTSEYLSDVAKTRRGQPGGVSLLTLPLHHGAGPAQVWGAVQLGNPTVMMRRFDPEGALRLIAKHRVTNWTGVPTMYKRLAALPKAVLDGYDVSSIRALSVGAAPVPYQLKQWIIGYFGGGVLGEGYGATEVGMISFLPPDMQDKKPGSSGRPHTHVDISIRDAEGRELPRNVSGEIWIRTPVTIRSYLNGQPLGSDTRDADGFFRVGDVGMLDDDGYLFITDRAKDMIIAGGVNIYPAEIEAAILKHPDVQDVAVIGIPDDEFGEQVKAFCELKPGHKADQDAILDFCREHLASYKRPKTLSIVDELPRNTMGKLLKRELREPYWKGRERNV